MHTPVDVTEQALALAKQCGADVTVALGGGSTTGLGKAIALRTDLPQIVIPTTYAGSEATPILGETKNGLKTTQRSMKVLPEVILYDVDLTLTLPARLSVTSGMNAIAHAVEALYAHDSNPITTLMAEEAIRALAQALPIIVKKHRSAIGRALRRLAMRHLPGHGRHGAASQALPHTGWHL
jgi:alcohol dehydrogenase class IV